MKKIHEMSADELRKELQRTEDDLTAIFEEAKRCDDPQLSSAYYEVQNEANRIRNRLWALEVGHA